MRILITGNLSSLALDLTRQLIREKHKIVLVAEDADDLSRDEKYMTIHSVHPASALFRDVIASYSVDVIVYLSTREEQLDFGINDAGKQLDGLRNALEICKDNSVKYLYYVSSTEVYGKSRNTSERNTPEPATINGHALLTGEKYCEFYADKFNVRATVIRVPHIYGINEKGTFLYKLIRESFSKKKVPIQLEEKTILDFLHADDVAEFLTMAIGEVYQPGKMVINLSGAGTITGLELVKILESYFPNVEYDFDSKNTVYTCPVNVDEANKRFGWVPLHDFRTELPVVIEATQPESIVKRDAWKGLLNNLSILKIILPWIELGLGAWLVQYLSDYTGTLIQFKYVDFRLLFVILMGLIHGIRFGLFAAVLAGAGIVYTWSRLDLSWEFLAFNVGNWLSFGLYFAGGVISGYSRDRKESEIEHERKQTALIFEKYKFLYEVFEEVRELKNEFREQVLGYEDSFGKIYNATHKLDSIQEDDVFVNAISILEEFMHNDSVAIYSLDSAKSFVRLEVNSLRLNGEIAKSIKLSDFPDVMESVNKNEIFQNTSLLPDYPAYVAPILNNEEIIVLVFLWNAKFDQYSVYYHNLFKVITGLIQDSLVRASVFMEVNKENLFVPNTRIFKPNAFVDILKKRVHMNKDKLATYALLWVEKDDRSPQDFYSQVSEVIRDGDIVGMRNDGNLYVLLPQADPASINNITKRLRKINIKCDCIEFLN